LSPDIAGAGTDIKVRIIRVVVARAFESICSPTLVSLKTETVDEHRGDFSGTDGELRTRFAQHGDIISIL
jgi:hypothetical protein